MDLDALREKIKAKRVKLDAAPKEATPYNPAEQETELDIFAKQIFTYMTVVMEEKALWCHEFVFSHRFRHHDFSLLDKDNLKKLKELLKALDPKNRLEIVVRYKGLVTVGPETYQDSARIDDMIFVRFTFNDNNDA